MDEDVVSLRSFPFLLEYVAPLGSGTPRPAVVSNEMKTRPTLHFVAHHSSGAITCTPSALDASPSLNAAACLIRRISMHG